MTTQQLPRKTISLLRQVQREIAKEPRRFIMHDFFDLHDNKAPCRTAACIAGHALILDARKKRKGKAFPELAAKLQDKFDGDGRSIMDTATKLLKLDCDQADRLFLDRSWPEEFKLQWQEALDRKAEARVAIKRIDFFIKTGATDEEEGD